MFSYSREDRGLVGDLSRKVTKWQVLTLDIMTECQRRGLGEQGRHKNTDYDTLHVSIHSLLFNS